MVGGGIYCYDNFRAGQRLRARRTIREPYILTYINPDVYASDGNNWVAPPGFEVAVFIEYSVIWEQYFMIDMHELPITYDRRRIINMIIRVHKANNCGYSV